MIGRDIEFWRQRLEEDAAIQLAVQRILRVARNWFEFKLPKWLACMSDLQVYVYSKQKRQPGNYSYFAALLENSFIKGPFSVLMDYDVPVSAIRKLEARFGDQTDWTVIEEQLRSINLDDLGLLNYERQKLLSAIQRAS